MNTETLDKLYLEWSQFTTARTAREVRLTAALSRLLRLIEGPTPDMVDPDYYRVSIISEAKHALTKGDNEEAK
jgi:hypothetical protein